MTYLLSVSFANEKVSEKSYARLVETMVTDPCKVMVFDNHYPLNRRNFIWDICQKYGFMYFSHDQNIGLYAAYNHLIESLPVDCEKVILYDGDSYPIDNDWHLALLNVIGGDVVTSTLKNTVNEREINERGYTWGVINGVDCEATLQPLTCTVSAFSIPFLRSCGGLRGQHKYYGGNEVEMWKHYDGKKWVFLDDFHEGTEQIKPLHDWQYEQYKLLYAHKGMDISFDDYLKTSPEKIENIEKVIFG